MIEEGLHCLIQQSCITWPLWFHSYLVNYAELLIPCVFPEVELTKMVSHVQIRIKHKCVDVAMTRIDPLKLYRQCGR